MTLATKRRMIINYGPCLTCSVLAGAPCVSTRGVPRVSPHRYRVNKYRREQSGR